MFRRRRDYVSWEQYYERMKMLELHAWQQATRTASLRNLNQDL